MQRRGLFRGQLIKLYILAYLAYRFATEFLRPEPVLALGLTGYQWACLVLAPVFLGLWVKDARSGPRAGPGRRAERRRPAASTGRSERVGADDLAAGRGDQGPEDLPG